MKNSALIISSDPDFINEYTEILNTTNFRTHSIDTSVDLTTYKIYEDLDCLLIDNRNENYKYQVLINYLKDHQFQVFIVNIGPKTPRIHKNPFHIFSFEENTHRMSLCDFLKSANKFVQNSRAMIDLARMLLHDTRSPLNSMIGYLELLLNNTFGELQAGHRKILEKTMELGDTTLEMLEDLSEVFKSSQHNILLQKQKFNLQSLIDTILIGIWVKADRKNIKITKHLSPEIIYLNGDDYQIQRVITNLLNNAIKYCPEHSTINLLTETTSENNILISVEDNGGGVDEQYLPRLFKKYFRVEEKNNLQKGYGLGLYICKLIVKSHGGKIWAENNMNGGLTISFTIPTSN